jgi:hypothetical protein
LGQKSFSIPVASADAPAPKAWSDAMAAFKPIE